MDLAQKLVGESELQRGTLARQLWAAPQLIALPGGGSDLPPCPSVLSLAGCLTCPVVAGHVEGHQAMVHMHKFAQACED